MTLRVPLLERIVTKLVFADTGCWEWQGATVGGYGVVRGFRRRLYVHRALYELVAGPIPSGLGIDHLCFNKRCANPAHLEPVTNSINSKRYWIHFRILRYRHCKRAAPRFRPARITRRRAAPLSIPAQYQLIDAVRLATKNCGLTRRELGERIGQPQRVVTDALCGPAYANVLIQLADYLGVAISA